MYRITKSLLAIVFIAYLSGCATVKPMPLGASTKSVEVASQSILLGRLTIKNENKPKHQLTLQVVYVEKDGKTISFTKPALLAETENVSNDFIFSLSSTPGAAELSSMNLLSRSLLINGNAQLPFKQEIVFPDSGIVYIGNITATIVPREDDQPRAGSVIPLIDQSVTGISSGTFVVDIADNFEQDKEAMIKKFPFLQGKEITKAILPKWQYPLAASGSN